MKDFKEKFVTQKNYAITMKNGSFENYLVKSVVNSLQGRMALKVIHPNGYLAFLMVDQIKRIQIL